MAQPYLSQHKIPEQKYNYASTDLWHDVSDDYPLYLEIKKPDSLNLKTIFLYWIEDVLQLIALLKIPPKNQPEKKYKTNPSHILMDLQIPEIIFILSTPDRWQITGVGKTKQA